VVKGHKKAKSYHLRFAALLNRVPNNWMTISVTSIKAAIPVNGLTPGTAYAFQARALGPAGHTDWTDSATAICT
jgi:hypothetical protein